MTDWQLGRVRAALRAFHRSQRDASDRSVTWIHVFEEILATAEENGISLDMTPKNGAERLRQFVEGVRNQDGTRKFPVPQPPLLAAVRAFVTDEDNQLLSEADLQVHIPGVQALLRMLEYLDDGSETGRLVPPEKLFGTYECSTGNTEYYHVWSLTLQKAMEEGLIQTILTEERWSVEALKLSNVLDPQARQKFMKSSAKHSGWAILTPEDNLLFFLKTESNKKNVFFYTVAASPTLWDHSSPFVQVGLVRHDYPLELDAAPVIWDEKSGERLREELSDKVMLFSRDIPYIPDNTFKRDAEELGAGD